MPRLDRSVAVSPLWIDRFTSTEVRLGHVARYRGRVEWNMAGQRSSVRRRALSVLVSLVTAVVVVGTATGAARGPATGVFARQAQLAGLDRVQAGVLQGRVDGYLRQLGGVQTAA